MVAEMVQENGRRDLLDRDLGDLKRGRPGLGAAYRLSGVIAILMVVASTAGLLLDGLYRDGLWAREALRGGDLTTIAVAAPVLITSMLFARRGSRAAHRSSYRPSSSPGSCSGDAPPGAMSSGRRWLSWAPCIK